MRRPSSRTYRALIRLEGVIAAEQGEDCITAQYDYAYGPRPPVVHRQNAEWFDPYEGIDYRISVGQGGKRRFQADQAPGPEHRPGKRPSRAKATGHPNFRGKFLTAAVPAIDVDVEHLEFPDAPPRPPARWAHLYSIPELAQVRRAGASFSRLAALLGHIDINTLRALLEAAEFDQWGWRRGMGQRCYTCDRPYSPWALRQRGRGVGSRWPSLYCSKICQDDEYNARPPG